MTGGEAFDRAADLIGDVENWGFVVAEVEVGDVALVVAGGEHEWVAFDGTHAGDGLVDGEGLDHGLAAEVGDVDDGVGFVADEDVGGFCGEVGVVNRSC